ncbi:GAF domain-containing sensor histidine kinase [Mangrovivirga sp. M17]|uniref:histidine kinase n=1 Tax=Mangrovivirga halotolerans TaxID=2993936 RepID=A0ABT3RR58_9BACT|nr:GAF domain-containing sensor histidine kinase [Mangrovivirga halotolerans]MCX2743976.1 GAF domain-containing sensor histidine kinase [Mangrovivirga halotolerans]
MMFVKDSEEARLGQLEQLQIMGTPEEDQYNRIVELASRICDVPISLISLIDKDIQWFKAKKGIKITSTSRELSFCSHSIETKKRLIIEDAFTDDRFKENPLVTADPNIRFYAGIPLINPKGYVLGSLCVIDRKPRTLSEDQLFALEVLSEQVLMLFDNRLKQKELDEKIKLLNEKNSRLTELNKLGNQFLSVISHDLKSPISTTQSLVYLLKNNVISDEDLEKYLNQMDIIIDGTNHLIENLVSWGYRQLDGKTKEISSVNPSELIASAVDLFKMNMEEKELEIQNNIPNSLVLKSDRDILLFVFRNLIHNAIKFSSKERIIVDYDEKEEEHIFSIRDSGTGMPLDVLRNINSGEILNSVKGTRGEKGSGLGIYMCKKFLDILDGNIIYESVDGYGTKVKVVLKK